MLATPIAGNQEDVKIEVILQLGENNKSHSGKKKGNQKKMRRLKIIPKQS